MKCLTQVVMLIALAAFTIGCSSGFSVSTDYDTTLDFSVYKTYDWMDEPSSGQGYDLQGLMHTRVQAAVDHMLQQKGYTKSADSPNLHVVYHTGKQQQTEIESYGYGYWGMGGVDTYTYDTGTLIVDLVDAQTKKLVWRGTAENTLSTDPSSTEVAQDIDMAVEKMFSKYPPK